MNGTPAAEPLQSSQGLTHVSTVVAVQSTVWVVADSTTVVNLTATAEAGEADYTGLVYDLTDSVQFGFNCQMDFTYLGNFS